MKRRTIVLRLEVEDSTPDATYLRDQILRNIRMVQVIDILDDGIEGGFALPVDDEQEK